MSNNLTDLQKAERINAMMRYLSEQYMGEDRPGAAQRVTAARMQLMSDTETAARLYDLLKEA